MAGADGTILFEDARILFRNFAGKEGMYNREGDRNFCVLLDPELAEQLANDGWNVKQLKSREEGVPGDFYLPVSVGFKGRYPTRMVLISSKGRVDLGQYEADIIDWVDIAKADLIIRPYNWGPINGKTGTKAYLKTLFIHLNEDYLELKYADVPEIHQVEGKRPMLQLEGPPSSDDEVVDGEIVYEGDD